jgi:hypothetical protein
MLCYRDITFCKYYSRCVSGDRCPRALTPEVLAAAATWWGSFDSPVCTFATHPDCFNHHEKDDDQPSKTAEWTNYDQDC